MIKDYFQTIKYEIPDDRLFLIPYINNFFNFWIENKELDLVPHYLKENVFNMFLKDNNLYYDFFGIKILNSPGLCYNNLFYNLFAHLIGKPPLYQNFYYSGDLFPTDEVPKDILINQYENLNVIDIGTNDGSFSIAASFYGAKSIYAFEASPQSYEIAIKNFNLNKISIKPMNVGLADKPCNERLFGILNNSKHLEPFELREVPGNKNIKNADFIESSIISLKVDTLDRIFTDNYGEFNYNDPCLISLDTNGSELNCLRGGAELLYSCKPVVSCKASSITDRLSIIKTMKSIDKKYKILNRGEFIFFYH